MEVAAALLFGRAIDAVPNLLTDLRNGSVRVVIDVPDPLVLAALRGIWPLLLFGDDARIETVSTALSTADAALARALSLVITQVPKAADRDDTERALLRLLQVSRPLLCLSPEAESHVPPAALRAADLRVGVPPLCSDLIGTVVRIVTGSRCRKADLGSISDLDITVTDLAIAIQADRSPAECMLRLRRLAMRGAERSGVGRDLSLDQLHGMADAVAWARSTLADLQAWRLGAPWSSVSSGAMLWGPPGTGKTLLAAVMAAEGDLPLVTGSLARWQAEDHAHLGTTLRAMRRAFEEAKLKAKTGRGGRRGCILLIDEIDSFADRSTVTHDHRDYVVEVVNGLLELIDGAGSREGVVVIGTTNDATRCDPALKRPGRLSKMIQVGYPDLNERLAMLRVRLGRDLHDLDLLPVARVTERATGADIEELVADARRIANRAERPLEMADLLRVAGRADANTPPANLRRIAVHEAGHAVVAALEIGTRGLVVALQSRESAAGWVEVTGLERTAGTQAEIEATIRIQLAGRAAEEVLLGAPSAGARQDLVAATTLAAHMIGSWGLTSTKRLLALGRQSPADILEDRELRDEAASLLDSLYEQARDTIRRHGDEVRRIAERLLVERRLDGATVAQILGVEARDPVREAAGSASPLGLSSDDYNEVRAGGLS
jgi:SpoVK/Ycf46/Vps4 family AAA+-type ATPase